jgi:AraC family transcriptional regulator of adaptative response / DNA-3-methyladenine glycosylase II
LRLIEEGVLDQLSVDELAGRLGVGPRHLHRLFVQHVGASPVALAQTRRLHFAKRLLDETNLPITEIALASGFGSLRRFNSVFRETYKKAPRDLRRRLRNNEPFHPAGDVVLKLAFRPPYDFAWVMHYLRSRAIPEIEEVEAECYSRTVRINHSHAIVTIRHLADENALELTVSGAPAGELLRISSAARRVFDVSADPSRIKFAFESDPILSSLVTQFPGMRIPGAWDPFECAVRAIIEEQVSASRARKTAAHFVNVLGKSLKHPLSGPCRLFPTPKDVVEADLRNVGLSAPRFIAIRNVARAVLEESIDFSVSSADVIAALSSLEGVSKWAAQYVALRALAEPDAFPSSDLQLRKVAGASSKPLSQRELEAASESWRPWRGYAAMLLWRFAEKRK